MAEIEYFIDPLKKEHKKYSEIKQIEVPLLTAQRQMDGASSVEVVSFEDAVNKKTIDNETLAYYMGRIYLFLIGIGINKEKIRFRQHMKTEMAHYACDCWDAELLTSYGWIECVGCADRSAYDLKVHSEKSNEKLSVREQLKEPIEYEKHIVRVKDKKKFGISMKKNAKLVEQHLLDMSSDQAELLSKELNEKHKITVVINNVSYELEQDIIKVTQEKIKEYIREYIPNVIEPSFGIGRIIYSLLEHSFYKRQNDEQRVVLSLNPLVAPYKCVLLPISNNPKFKEYMDLLSIGLKQKGIMHRVDSSATSIGRRYSRNDELGIPFAITIDFQTLDDNTITLRERDTLVQIRNQREKIINVLQDITGNKTQWKDALIDNPVVESQEE